MKSSHKDLPNRFPQRVVVFFLALTTTGFLAETASAQASASKFRTVAESSGYQATSRSDQVARFVNRVTKSEKRLNKFRFGRTVEGRPLLAVVAGDPPVSNPAELAANDRLVVFVLGNIHSGECAGKEALLALLRDVADDKFERWFQHLVVVAIPNFNADGNDRISTDHRTGQEGPTHGAGIRENAQHLDLNRDFVKLESPEVQALIKLANSSRPSVFIDLHTTNGSLHRYDLTFDFPHNPAVPAESQVFLRDTMLPAVQRRLAEQERDTFFYGNFDEDQRSWTTFDHRPRFSTEYFGLRGTLAILSEAYAYAPYETRVRASYEFVTNCLDYVAEEHDAILELTATVRQRPDSQYDQPETIPIAAELDDDGPMVTVRGYQRKARENDEGKADSGVSLDLPRRDYELKLLHRYRATKTVARPFAYLIPADHTRVAHHMQLHGVAIERLTAATTVDITRYRIAELTRSQRAVQGHRELALKTTIQSATEEIPAGTLVVRTAQPLAALISYLLEPSSDDGLATWNLLDRTPDKDRDFPILRVEQATELDTRSVTEFSSRKQLTLEAIYSPDERVSFAGRTPRLSWVPKSSNYRIQIDDTDLEIDAATGGQRRVEPEDLQPIIEAFTRLPGINKEDAKRIAGRGRKSPDGGGRFFQHANDLYYYSATAKAARRLTHDNAQERFAQFSPDGSLLAFVRDHNLFVVSVADGPAMSLTTDGTGDIMMGELDWAYQEEVYGRGNYRAFWWSPDSRHIAFLRVDQSQVKSYTVTDNIPYRQEIETTRYPKAGDPIAAASLGVVSAVGGSVQWLYDVTESADETLIVRVSWSDDSNRVIYQVQNREQTWLELRSVNVGDNDDNEKLLLRETSPAWVDPLGTPRWLKDGSFLWLSERSGQRHLYHVSADGQESTPLTAGKWSVRTVLGVDTEQKWVYFTATKDSPVHIQGYRVRSDGKRLERITEVRTTKNGKRRRPKTVQRSHRIVFNDDYSYFLDYSSKSLDPGDAWVCRSNGRRLHCAATNRHERLHEYKIDKPTFLSVPTRDGGTMQATLIKPPDFDPQKRYPVLCHVYSGPGAPQVADRWRGSSAMWHQLMAQHGYCIWVCDNRSAGNNIGQTWPIHKRLGERELSDIEDGLNWLNKKPWIDPQRIGMWGWSYGGYMTSYALTHSTRFRAGIAGAPVTDWRNYDAIYTERYMGLPQQNVDGYRISSAVEAAERIHGRLLLIHGSKDDNVHLANTLQLAYALQKAGKPFEMMVYPKSRHGVGDSRQVLHLRRLMTQFLLENL